MYITRSLAVICYTTCTYIYIIVTVIAALSLVPMLEASLSRASALFHAAALARAAAPIPVPALVPSTAPLASLPPRACQSFASSFAT